MPLCSSKNRKAAAVTYDRSATMSNAWKRHLGTASASDSVRASGAYSRPFSRRRYKGILQGYSRLTTESRLEQNGVPAVAQSWSIGRASCRLKDSS